mgnify:CR=1 FL=1
MKSFHLLITFLLLSIITSKATEEQMQKFAQCAKDQVGKPFVTTDSRGPDSFSNSGLVWYCRGVAGLSKTSTIYVSWKRVKQPKVGAHVYGIKKDNGVSVSSDCLGVIVAVNPTYIVQGDPITNVLDIKKFTPDPKYIRTEYHYVDL